MSQLDMIPSSEAVAEGKRLVENWSYFNKHVALQKIALDKTERELTEAKNALSKFFTPKDAKNGESFHLWILGGLLEITVCDFVGPTPDHHIYLVSWRQKPKEWID